jgi:lipoate-protein ligase A
VRSRSKIGWEELKATLLQGFRKALGIRLYEEPPTPEELELARKLAQEKYRASAWSYDGRHET